MIWNWLIVLALAVWMWRIEHSGPASIGLRRPTSKDLTWALAFGGFPQVTSMVISAILGPEESTGLQDIVDLPIIIVIGIIITTSTTEEVLFRGYPLERIRMLTGQWWPAVVVSAVLFVLPHRLFFGPSWLLYHGVGVGLFYVLYVWRRNLWACMLMHFMGNALLLLPATGVVE